MTKDELLEKIKDVDGDSRIIFSISDDSKPYPFLRAFGREVYDVVTHGQETTIVMSGDFNNDAQKP